MNGAEKKIGKGIDALDRITDHAKARANELALAGMNPGDPEFFRFAKIEIAGSEATVFKGLAVAALKVAKRHAEDVRRAAELGDEFGKEILAT